MTSSSVDKPEESVASKPSMPAPASTTSEDQQNHSPPPSEEQRQSLPEHRPQQPSETTGRREQLSDPELSHIKMTTTTRTSIGVKLRLVHWACIVLIGITAGMGTALALETSAVGDPTIHSKPTFSFSALRLYLAISTRVEPAFLESSHRRAFLYTIIVSVSILFITIIINALRFETENISTWDVGQQCKCMCSKRAVRANDIRAGMHPRSEMLQAARRLLAALQPAARLRNGVIIQVQESEEAIY